MAYKRPAIFCGEWREDSLVYCNAAPHDGEHTYTDANHNVMARWPSAPEADKEAK